jgi:hypothetical protein
MMDAFDGICAKIEDISVRNMTPCSTVALKMSTLQKTISMLAERSTHALSDMMTSDASRKETIEPLQMALSYVYTLAQQVSSSSSRPTSYQLRSWQAKAGLKDERTIHEVDVHLTDSDSMIAEPAVCSVKGCLILDDSL